MKTKRFYLIWAFVLLVFLVFTACDNFFSKTWGKERDYDPANIDLTVDNMDDWLDASVGRPNLAKAVNAKIKKMTTGMASGPKKEKFQKAAVKLAFEASGVGTSLLSNADKLIDAAEDGDADAMKKILDSILKDFKSSGGPGAANDLTAILDDGYIENASQTERDMAAVVLALAILAPLKINNFDDITLDDFGLEEDSNGDIVPIDQNDKKLELLASILMKSAENSDSLAGSIKGFGFN